MGDNKDLSIGEVIMLLRDDFPDVSVSKIRFLESQGLIDPDRTTSGYRQFDRDDLARLRFILQQQRDHFLPLKVIKSKLTLWERGEDDGDDEAGQTLEQPGEPLDREALGKRSGLSDEVLGELIAMGLIHPVGETDVFHPDSVAIAAEAKRLLDLGLEPRHLRVLKLSTDREASLILSLAGPLLKAANPDARAKGRDILENGADSIRVIHRALLSQELRQQL